MSREILPSEVEIVGTWPVHSKGALADAEEQRIVWLLENSLNKVAQDSSGWQVLYLDARDGRLWELTFPHSEMHGGGPRRLAWITETEAKLKYSFS